MTTTETSKAKIEPALKLKFLSHGTLECRDIKFTRRFYEEFLGFDIVQTSVVSMWCRLGGFHIYACIQNAKKQPMPLLSHNGIDVETDDDVDECYQTVMRDAEKWGLHDITKPHAQHGSYSFYFFDADDNAWEILSNPPGGYCWMYERGDQAGMGHMKKSFERPESTQRKKS